MKPEKKKNKEAVFKTAQKCFLMNISKKVSLKIDSHIDVILQLMAKEQQKYRSRVVSLKAYHRT